MERVVFQHFKFQKMHVDSPGYGAELANAAAQVVEEVQRPAVDSHGIVHVMLQVCK